MNPSNCTKLHLLLAGLVLSLAGCRSGAEESADPGTRGAEGIASAASALGGSPWVATAPMGLQRWSPAATRLLDGRVLVTGGDEGPTHGRSSEIYDPATNTWTNAGVMEFPHSRHDSVLLPDGKVFVVGGSNSYYGEYAEIYDPVTTAWRDVGRASSTPVWFRLAPLPNGKVLIIGGERSQTYDPNQGWMSTNPPNASQEGPQAPLPGGKVLIISGVMKGPAAAIEGPQIYDATTNMWSIAAQMNTPRRDPALVALADHRVLAAGGLSDTNDLLDSAEIYDPVSGTWAATAPMSIPRGDHRAVLLHDGKVLVAGGRPPLSNPVASAELFDPLTETWTSAGDMVAPRGNFALALLADGAALAAGGGSNLAGAELYAPPVASGAPCDLLVACQAGFCVDGVCCDTPCDAGASDACSVAAGAPSNGTCALDLDGDGVFGSNDNCPNAVNPSQLDSNSDGQGNACDPTCVNLRRGQLGSVADTRIGISSPNANYGSTTTLVSGGTDAETKQVLLRFDLSLVPSHTRITSAGLTIKTLKASGAGSVRVHRAESLWDEGTVTWSNFGGAYDAALLASFPNTTGPHSFDVKALAQRWVHHPEENFGLLFEQDAGTMNTFKSSEYGVIADRPSLFGCYVPTECSPGSGDCDGTPENGCEASIDAVASCGLCGHGCDDGNDCTADSCDGPMFACGHAPEPDGHACSNGFVCRGGACQVSTCSDGIMNQGEGDVDCGGPCESCALCSPGFGDCDHESFYSFDGCESQLDTFANCGACGINCDDGNSCTDDACGPGATCAHTPAADGKACSNGDGCSVGSTCLAGACAGGSPVACDPGAGLACDPAQRWSRPLMLSSLKISIDSGDNVVFSGLAWGKRDFGGGLRGGDSINFFLVKLDPTGLHLFSHGFPIDGGLFDASSAVDPQGSIVIAGRTDGSFYIGGVAMTGAFFAKFDPAGNLLWAREPPPAACGDTMNVSSLSVDQVGGVLLTVTCHRQDLLFSNVVATKLDPSGNMLWSKALWKREPFHGDNPSVYVASVVPTGSGLLVSGSYRRAFSLAGVLLSGGYNYNMFVAEFDAQGNLVSVQSYGDSTEDQFGGGLAHGDPGPVIVAGGISFGTIDFGSGPIVPSPTCSRYLAGVGLWNKCFPATATDSIEFHVLKRVGGSLLAAGSFHGTIDFGNGPVTSGGGDERFFAARYDIASGSLLALQLLGPSPGHNLRMAIRGDDIVVGANGPLVEQGSYQDDAMLEKFSATGDPCSAAPSP